LKKFLEIEPEYSKFDTSKFVVIPVPYEATTSYVKGTKKGPAAILEASQMVEDYDIELASEPYKKVGIHTFPAVKFSKRPHDDIYRAAKKVFIKHKIPVILGGEHSVTLGPVKAAKELYPDLTVLQFDAHSDLRDEYHGNKFSHACIMRRVREVCGAVQVGVRSQDIEETKYLKDNGLMGSIYYADSYDDSKIPAIVKQLSNNVYISFDVDALDPSIMPSTGTPEPGGLSWKQTLDILKAVISSRNIIGFDVVELSPNPGLHHADYTVAKLIYKMIGYIGRKL
jgi:agmatinase